MKGLIGVLALALASWILSNISYAQSQPSRDQVLAADSWQLFESFFQYHSSIADWLDQLTAAHSDQAQDFDKQSAKQFHVDVSELAKLAGITRSVRANLQNIEHSLRDHVNARAKFEAFPDPAVLQQLTAQRQQAVLDGMNKLSQTLSATGWAGLRDYVNNTHRLYHRMSGAPVQSGH